MNENELIPFPTNVTAIQHLDTEKNWLQMLRQQPITQLSADDILEKSLFNDRLDWPECSFWQLKSISHDQEIPRREAMESIVSMLDNPLFNFVYILSGNGHQVDIYLGIVNNRINQQGLTEQQIRYKAKDINNILSRGIAAHFQGSKLHHLSRQEIEEKLLGSAAKMQRAGLLFGVPNISETEKQQSTQQQIDVQGIDRVINAMRGKEWQIVIVCEPVERAVVDREIEILSDMYDEIQRVSKVSFQLTAGESDGSSTSINVGDSDSYARGTSDSRALGINLGENEGSSRSKTDGFSTTHSTSSSDEDGKNSSSTSRTTSQSTTVGTQRGTSKGVSVTDTKGMSETDTVTKNRGVGVSNQVGTNRGGSISQEILDKRANDTMKYLDEELLKRLRLGMSKGLFKTSLYALAQDLLTYEQLRTCLMSTYQGDTVSVMPLAMVPFGNPSTDGKTSENETSLITHYQTFNSLAPENLSAEVAHLRGLPIDEKNRSVGLSTYLTPHEISIMAGIPLKEVSGIPLQEGVEFGINIPTIEVGSERTVLLGHVMQRGEELPRNQVLISRDNLMKHVFVAGVTGSGKTTTCQRLLIESQLPFLVIEPAKTEYRVLLNQFRELGITIWTLGKEQLAPFRFNPFELLRDTIISSHIDLLKASFTAAFHMEAAMPQLLEEALYKTYEDFGWDIDINENRKTEDPWEDDEGIFFPTLSDFINTLDKVVESKNFAPELKQNYVGSLVSRFNNLTVGSKGQMLNCRKSIDFEKLLDSRTILELEELKAPEDKAFLIGLILVRMTDAIKRRHRKDHHFRHLTLVEEAHRLLSKSDGHDSGAKRNAVEMFADLLAEVRKYGEGLIIVDQIPNKLAPEVLKNTNTKIIHKLLAKDDKEAIGDTMMMNDKQKQFLSSLEPGQAIMFTEGWTKPVNIKVVRNADTSSAELEDKEIKHMNWPSFREHLDGIVGKRFATLVRSMNDVEKEIESTGKLTRYLSVARRCLVKRSSDKAWRGKTKLPDFLELFAATIRVSDELGINARELIDESLNRFQKYREVLGFIQVNQGDFYNHLLELQKTNDEAEQILVADKLVDIIQ